MSDDNIKDHPNLAFRKEIATLKTRVSQLELESLHNSRAILVIVEKQEVLRDLLVRSLSLMAKAEAERSSQNKG